MLLQLECLRCLAQWDLQMLVSPVSFPQSRDCQQSVQLVQLVVHVSAPSYVALSPSQLSEDPSRTFDSHVSVQCSQLVSMVSRHKPKHAVEKIPPSFLRRSLRTQPQPAFDISDLIRDSHNAVLSHVRDEFLTMMFKEFTTGRLELNLALNLANFMFIRVI